MKFFVQPDVNECDEQVIPFGRSQLQWKGADLNIAGLALILVSENSKTQLRYPMNPMKRTFLVNIKGYKKAYLTYRFTDKPYEVEFELT